MLLAEAKLSFLGTQEPHLSNLPCPKYTCIRYLFLFSVFLMLWYLGTCWLGRECPSQGSPGDSKGEQTKPETMLSATSPPGSHTPGGDLPARCCMVIIPGPGIRHLEIPLYPRACPKYSKHSKDPYPCFPLLPPPDWPRCFSIWPCVHGSFFLLGNVNNKLSF